MEVQFWPADWGLFWWRGWDRSFLIISNFAAIGPFRFHWTTLNLRRL